MLDRDQGFLRALERQVGRVGGEQVVIPVSAPPQSIAPLRISAVVVDLGVLGAQGWDWLGGVRRELPQLGLVVCTASSSVAQRVRGLRLGADDWLTKPCHPTELVARLEAVVRGSRRLDGFRELQPLVAGELELRSDQYEAFVDGRRLDLTRREFELIDLLAGCNGRVLEREFIYRRLWGYAMTHGDRSVDVFVRKLRHKLEIASPEWRYIHTHFGIGYRFAAQPGGRGGALGRDEEPAAAGPGPDRPTPVEHSSLEPPSFSRARRVLRPSGAPVPSRLPSAAEAGPGAALMT